MLPAHAGKIWTGVSNGSLLHAFNDTIRYDNYGNVLSHGTTRYQYDYSKKPRQQFYCDDFMGADESFYLLQYLGYFPELNNPVNLRTYTYTEEFSGPLTDHQFDGEGRLISYEFESSPVTITWK